MQGKYFTSRAAPLLDDIIYTAASVVPSPNQTVLGQTIYDLWDKKIRTMGSGSDFAAFQDLAGIPSLDLGFGARKNDPVYHYHSNYDSFHWMEKFGDPGFVYHRAVAQVLGVITARLADLPVIPFRAADYARALGRYVKQVEDKLDEVLSPSAELAAASLLDDDAYFELRGSTRNLSSIVLASSSSSSSSPTDNDEAESLRVSLGRLYKALDKLDKRATELDKHADKLSEEVGRDIPWWKWPSRLKLWWDIRKVNTKYKYLDRSFLYEKGLDGRSWFKHVVFAPGLWTGYAGGEFPPLPIIFFSLLCRK